MAHVAGKHQPLHRTAEHAEWSLELDVVGQARAVLDRLESMLVTERPERTLALLVDESPWSIPLGDDAGHRPRDAEMAGPPRHELAQPDHTTRHSAHRPLPRPLERLQMSIDRQREVE